MGTPTRTARKRSANGKASSHRGGSSAKARAAEENGELLKRALRSNGSARRNGGARGGVATKRDARRAAMEISRAMLVASSWDTARHSDDVEVISEAICAKLELNGAEREDILAAARLHDIGKTSIPGELLEKSGPLTAREWKVMRGHTIKGEEILSSVPEFESVAQLVRFSHERWDGEGYPDGLAGEEIPLGSRIIFCADAFHAIRCDRPYRQGRPAAASLAEVKRCAGTQFDPRVVIALEEVVRELRMVPTGRRTKRSSRLMALLLTMVLGVGGSAVARSDLLGTPAPGAHPATAATFSDTLQCDVDDCPALLGVSLLDLLGRGDAAGAVAGKGGKLAGAKGGKGHRKGAGANGKRGEGKKDNARDGKGPSSIGFEPGVGILPPASITPGETGSSKKPKKSRGKSATAPHGKANGYGKPRPPKPAHGAPGSKGGAPGQGKK